MKTNITKAFVATILASGFALAHADFAITTGDTWNYVGTTDANTPAALGIDTTGWTNTGYDDSKWLTGNAPFGNTSDAQFGYTSGGTFWDVYHKPLVRKTLHFATLLDAVHVDLGVDNGYDLFVNGTHVSGDNAEGFTYRWEYQFNVDPTLFHVGDNVVAVALEDHGGATAFDMQMDVKPSAVPEPATFAGLILGLGCIAARRVRRG